MTGEAVEESLATRAGRLFAEYRDGDEARMAELVRILTPILWHTARSSRLDTAIAEDVLQTVWLTLVRKARQHHRAARRAAVDGRHHQARGLAGVPHAGQGPTRGPGGRAAPWRRISAESVEDSVVRAETGNRLWQHIDALPERCRTLLRVIAFADRPDYAELAKALAMPQGSIGPTRGRCLAKLRIALAQDPSWET